MASICRGRLRLLSPRPTPGGATPESILFVSACPAMGCDQERVHLYVSLDPDGLFSRDRRSNNSVAGRGLSLPRPPDGHPPRQCQGCRKGAHLVRNRPGRRHLGGTGARVGRTGSTTEWTGEVPFAPPFDF